MALYAGYDCRSRQRPLNGITLWDGVGRNGVQWHPHYFNAHMSSLFISNFVIIMKWNEMDNNLMMMFFSFSCSRHCKIPCAQYAITIMYYECIGGCAFTLSTWRRPYLKQISICAHIRRWIVYRSHYKRTRAHTHTKWYAIEPLVDSWCWSILDGVYAPRALHTTFSFFCEY